MTQLEIDHLAALIRASAYCARCGMAWGPTFHLCPGVLLPESRAQNCSEKP